MKSVNKMTERQKLIAGLIKQGLSMREIRKAAACGSHCVLRVKQLLVEGFKTDRYLSEYELAELASSRHGKAVICAFDRIAASRAQC